VENSEEEQEIPLTIIFSEKHGSNERKKGFP
jgi:hypothetical protein